MFCDVIDFCRQGRHGLSVWIFRDVFAFSRHGRHGFSVWIFRDAFVFNDNDKMTIPHQGLAEED